MFWGRFASHFRAYVNSILPCFVLFKCVSELYHVLFYEILHPLPCFARVALCALDSVPCIGQVCMSVLVSFSSLYGH